MRRSYLRFSRSAAVLPTLPPGGKLTRCWLGNSTFRAKLSAAKLLGLKIHEGIGEDRHAIMKHFVSDALAGWASSGQIFKRYKAEALRLSAVEGLISLTGNGNIQCYY